MLKARANMARTATIFPSYEDETRASPKGKENFDK